MEAIAHGNSGMGIALSGYQLFQSDDIEQTRKIVGDVFCPHDLKITGKNQKLDARMQHARIGAIAVSRLQYGADVAIDPGQFDDFLLVQMPLVGDAVVTCGNSTVNANPTVATVITPKLPRRMWWSGCCDKVLVQIPRDVLDRNCMQHLGHELRQPIKFELGMNLAEGGGKDWQRLVAFLVDELNQHDSTFLNSPLVRAQMVEMLVTRLLLCQPSNYQDVLMRPVPPIAPYHVKRVEEYIAEHAEQPITIIDLANYAGVSTRALYSGFRNFRNTSPMAYLKSIRLKRAHEDLLNAVYGDRVTTIAMRWGFTHLGNFTADYKRRFGEQPSDTLKR
ncbi:MAG: AraC family transcriptional regulator [Glaciimonas sp.]|nr:AraC family transcriptional regulator [Glaciimonas sp.]